MLFQTGTDRAAKAVKLALAGAAFACSLAMAPAASAASYFLQNFSMNTDNIAHITGPDGFDQYFYLAPLKFRANFGTSATSDTFNLLAFCVDLYHGIDMNDSNLLYDDNYGLTTDSRYTDDTLPPTFLGANNLVQDQIDKVSRLVIYGEEVAHSTDPERINKLAAVQGAIWQTINSGFVVDSIIHPEVNDYIAAYVSPTFLADRPVPAAVMLSETGYYGSSLGRQALAVTVDIPEPATWVMMIGGFGFAGAMLRRRRTLSLAA